MHAGTHTTVLTPLCFCCHPITISHLPASAAASFLDGFSRSFCAVPSGSEPGMGNREYQVGWEGGSGWRKCPRRVAEVYYTSHKPFALYDNLFFFFSLGTEANNHNWDGAPSLGVGGICHLSLVAHPECPLLPGSFRWPVLACLHPF